MLKNKRVPLVHIMIAVLALPLMVIVVIPLILHSILPPQLTMSLFKFRGQLFITITIGLIGFALLYSTNRLFVRQGRGTLAPWLAPEELVTQGPYKHMRHPMISGVLFILLSEIFYLASWASVIWFIFFLIANLVYIPLLEEKILAERFGREYQRYRERTPGWVPRLSSWKMKK